MKTKVEPTVDKWEEEFEDKFVPLMPGFSVARDWTKTLPGVTANYMTLKSFVRHSVQEAKEQAYRDGDEVGFKRACNTRIKKEREEAKAERDRELLGEWVDIENGLYHLCYKLEDDGKPHMILAKYMKHSDCENCKINASLKQKVEEV